MSVKIIVDSTVDMSPAAKARVAAVVPLSVIFGDTEYKDGVTITAHEFYEMLADREELPTSSQPTPASYADAFEVATADGSDVVVITISSRLSGSYQGACISADDFDGKVLVCDSRSAAVGAGALAEYALQLADKGMSAQEILDELNAAKEKLRIYFMVDTLEYLKKGGRLPGAVAVVGGLLNIKPILAIDNGGEIKLISSARGLKKAFSTLTENAAKDGGPDFTKPTLLGYTGTNAENLSKYRAEYSQFWPAETGESVVGAAIGVHVGPGAVAIAFFMK